MSSRVVCSLFALLVAATSCERDLALSPEPASQASAPEPDRLGPYSGVFQLYYQTDLFIPPPFGPLTVPVEGSMDGSLGMMELLSPDGTIDLVSGKLSWRPYRITLGPQLAAELASGAGTVCVGERIGLSDLTGQEARLFFGTVEDGRAAATLLAPTAEAPCACSFSDGVVGIEPAPGGGALRLDVPGMFTICPDSPRYLVNAYPACAGDPSVSGVYKEGTVAEDGTFTPTGGEHQPYLALAFTQETVFGMSYPAVEEVLQGFFDRFTGHGQLTLGTGPEECIVPGADGDLDLREEGGLLVADVELRRAAGVTDRRAFARLAGGAVESCDGTRLAPGLFVTAARVVLPSGRFLVVSVRRRSDLEAVLHRSREVLLDGLIRHVPYEADPPPSRLPIAPDVDPVRFAALIDELVATDPSLARDASLIFELGAPAAGATDQWELFIRLNDGQVDFPAYRYAPPVCLLDGG